MPESRRFRLSALFAGIAVVAASVLPAFPAAAEEPPTPDPVVTSEPTTPPVEPFETPTPEVTPTEAPAPVVTPTEEPAVDPEPTQAPAAAGTVVYSGSAQQIAEEEGVESNTDVVLFGVNGMGYLNVDISGLPTAPQAISPVTLTLKVPAGVTLTGDPDARFAKLAAAGAKKPLVAISSTKLKQTTPKQTSALLNQTINVPATHHVFAVYVSPTDKPVMDAGQNTNTAAQTLVTYADTYWNAQSSGSVRFTLDGVVPWYQSTYSCKTNAGNTSLWNQAMVKAKAQGFVPGKNMHLLLIFPNDLANGYAYCNGPIGLGTVGGAVNQGGLTWVMGSTDPIAKETTAHELGHNISLGHASWLACTSATPNIGQDNTLYSPPGVVGCSVRNYGDTSDVMGFGLGDGASGALSSPQAIRSGIWPSTAWVTAPAGPSNYTLLPVAGHSGLRSILVQDFDGTIYFVELRNQINEDAGNTGICNTEQCRIGTPNVRILRFEPSGWAGIAGEDTYLLGRSTSSVGYTGAGTWAFGGGSINVTAVSATQASVTINRTAATGGNLVTHDWVQLSRFLNYDSKLRVGDQMTLLLGDYWNGETYTYTWLRNKVPIAGATGSSYTIQAADIGKGINAYVTVSGVTGKKYDNQGGPGASSNGYGPVVAGFYQANDPGAVTVTPGGATLQATPSLWPSGTTFKYQWFRGASAGTATTVATGSGATTATYTPNTSDYNQFVRVRVTATVPGYSAVVRYSDARNDSLVSANAIVVSGTPKVGTGVSVDVSGLAFTNSMGAAQSGVTLTYQWLRNGVAIAGSPNANNYTLGSLDYNANITLRVTGSKPGFVSRVLTSSSFKPTIKGTITATSPTASIDNTFDAVAPMKVRLTLSQTGVTESDTTASYQWYRVNITTGVATAITGATLATYKPVAADYPYKIRAIITVKKTNYDNLPITTPTRDYSVRLGIFPLGFTGTAQVAQTLGISDPEFLVELSPGSYGTFHYASPGTTETFQWRRAGVNLAGQIASSYLIGAADLSKALSYSVKLEIGGYLAYSAVSPSTAAVIPATYTSGGPPLVVQTGFKLEVTPSLTDINPNATSFKIQWYRNGVAVAGKTTGVYTLTSADFGRSVTARISYIKAGYATYVMTADDGTDLAHQGKWWISANAAVPKVSGDVEIGGELSVDARTYANEYSGMALTPGADVLVGYQWLRNGVAITGVDATDDGDYTLQAADKGKTISVRVTALDGATPDALLPNIATSVATPAVGTWLLHGAETSAPTLVVQATSTTFATTLGFTSTAGNLQTGITSPGGAANKVTYQWLRNGVAIANATKSTYLLTQTDRLKNISLRITTSHVAIGPTTFTTDVRYTDAQDFTIYATSGGFINYTGPLTVGVEMQPTVPTYTNAAGGTLTIIAPPQYQWYRDGMAIPAAQGGTRAYYNPKAADLSKKITVRVTVGVDGLIPNVTTYTTVPATTKVLVGTLLNTSTAPTVALFTPATNTLKATQPDVTGAVVFPAIETQHATFTYQWYRDNPLDATPAAAIAGAKAQTYALTSADANREVFVKATAVLAGYTSVPLPPSVPIDYSIRPALTPNAPYLSSSTWQVGGQAVVYYLNFVTNDGPLSGETVKLQWYKTVGTKTTAIVGATSEAYNILAADYNTKLSLRITVSKPGYVTLVLTLPFVLVIAKGVDTNTWTPVVQEGPTAGILTAAVNDLAPVSPTPTYAYKWLRNGVVIAGATAKTYKLVAADFGKLIRVQVTMTRTNFNPLVLATKQSADADHTIYANSTPAMLSGGLTVGQALTAPPPDFYDDALFTTPTVGLTYAYTWYRSGVAIAGQTSDTYLLQAADVGKTITAKVTATMPGRLAVTSALSTGVGPIIAGNIDIGSYLPSVSVSSVRKATVSLTGAITSPAGPFTVNYKWYRGNTATPPLTTASSYTFTSADSSKQVVVVVTVSKPGYQNHVFATVLANEIKTVGDVVISDATPDVDDTLSATLPTFLHPGSATETKTYQWKVGGDSVAGETGPTYVVREGDQGQSVRLVVIVKSPYYADLAVENSAGVVVNP